MLCIAAVCIAGCQQEDDWGFQPGEGNGGFFPMGGSSGGQNNGGFGSGDLNPVDLQNDLDREVDYPQLRYTGDGNIASIDSRNPTQVATSQEFSAEMIRMNTTRFTSSDSTIDKRVRKLVGFTEFERTPKKEIILREDEDKFKNLSFVMYVSRSKSNTGYGGNTLTYSSPIPAAVVPTEMAQYDVLGAGGVTYSAAVIDDDGTRFEIVSTISEMMRSGSTIKIQQLTEIQGNHHQGKLYDKLHLPRITQYEIDTVGKKVLSIYSDDYYYNEKKGLRNTTITLQLCSYTLKGQTQNFPCPNY